MRTHLLPALLLIASSGLNAQTLGLQDFLQQVNQSNQGVRAAKAASEGASERAEEAELLFTPSVFAEGSYSLEEQPTPRSPLMGEQTKKQSYSLGIQTTTRFGMSGKLYYNVLFQEEVDLDPQFARFIPNTKTYDSRPKLELTQPLWRNGFGSEVRQQAVQQEASALEKSYSESFRKITSLVDAEKIYWRLVFAREVVRIQKENLTRAEKLRQWNQRRARLELNDKSDLLQAEAALKLRTLELKAATDEERMASRAFNSARGVQSDNVDDQLQASSVDQVLTLTPPAEMKSRDDIKAAEQSSRVATATAQMGVERQKPQLELFGNIGANGRDSKLNGSMNEANSLDYTNQTIGLRFVAPLDFGLLSRNKQAYRKEAQAARETFERKQFEQQNDWQDLLLRFEEAKARLTLAREIEKVQEEKMLHERRRLQNGRTTTYQSLLFEQDFASSQLNRVQSELEVLHLNAQFKLFGGSI